MLETQNQNAFVSQQHALLRMKKRLALQHEKREERLKRLNSLKDQVENANVVVANGVPVAN